MSNVTQQINDLRSYSRHWLGEFIEIYQSEECLWQPKHPDYSNHSVRNKAYDKLVEKLREVEPNPDRAMVVRKINSLRSAFRREYRKTNSKDNYETRLWYYEKLLFIAEQNPRRFVGSIDVKPMKRSLPLSFDDDDSLEFEEEHQLDTPTPQENNHNADTTATVTVSANECVSMVKSEEHTQHHNPHQQQQQQQLHLQAHPGQPHTAVKVLEITSLDSNSQRELQQAVSSLEQQHQMQQHLQQQQAGQPTQLAQIHQQVPNIQTIFPTYSAAPTTHRQDDEYDAIGINVASKLRVMNPTQRIIAEKLISDVLFNGQLDNLSVTSTLTPQLSWGCLLKDGCITYAEIKHNNGCSIFYYFGS
ncbi:uncharacterized protein LOC119681209 [Teleopsis dalmanni]|uniref:uncharacterized protein LOC119681209 n=1 Tax=Teleopsis dalmanni TaxID=139649 RepID=UPI0018CDFD45|nr:uncharacterized protein LOC119681209 [Teleopsis dalmanni]